MKLYDALVFLGRDWKLGAFEHSDLDSVRRYLDKYGIAKALLTALAARTLDVAYGNQVTFDAAGSDDRLVPCPAVLPNAGLEVGDEGAFLDDLIRRGARAVCLFPKTHGVPLDRRVVGTLFAALETRRLPVALFESDLLDVASLAADYPGLPVIVHTPAYRDRALLPCLKSAPNLYVSIAPNFAPYRGLEVLVEQCGADRILLASSFPTSEPGAPISQLLYSALSDEDVEKIASGNLRRLMAGVRVPGGMPAEPAPSPSEPATRIGGICEYVWQRQRLPWQGIVDMHAHYGKWGGFPIWGGDADDMVAEMDRIGVEKIFLSHHACISPETPWGNDQVLDGMRRFPDRILGYAACYPMGDSPPLNEIERCIDAGMRGIKLHNGIGVPYDDERYRPVWQFADERRLPVLLHTWGAMDKYESVFEQYHRAPILLGHSGSSKPEKYVEYARKYPNVWLELCYSRAPYGVPECFVREVGAERVLFGSDAPWMSMQQQLGRVLFADISDADKRTILVQNPRRILGGD